MELTNQAGDIAPLTTTFKENRMTVLQFLQAAKENIGILRMTGEVTDRFNPSLSKPFSTHTFYQEEGGGGSSRPPDYLNNRCPYEREIFAGYWRQRHL